MKIRYRTVLCTILAAAVAAAFVALPYSGMELLAEEAFFIEEETGGKDHEDTLQDPEAVNDPDGGSQLQDGEGILPGTSGLTTDTPASPFDPEEPETLPPSDETEAEAETETGSSLNPGPEEGISDADAGESGTGEEESEERVEKAMEEYDAAMDDAAGKSN